jgi:hypothetical protein
MSDFFAPPPGYPEVPADPPTPPPDFQTVGANIGIGLQKSGATSSWLTPLYDILVRAATTVLGVFFNLTLRLAAFVINLLGNAETDSAVAYGAVVAATLKELFGVTVDPATVNTRAGGSGKQAAANAAAQAILGTLFSGVSANPSGGITPSDQAANSYLAVAMNMEISGWLESWLADATSNHLLEKYGDLKDGITRVLGLGRMSRQVFAPPLKVLVHDPYLALLNQTYRPKAPEVAAVVRAFFRGEFDRTGLSSYLAPLGYTEQEISWLVTDHTKYLSNEDVDYLISRGIWNNDQAVTYLAQQGYETVGAQQVLSILQDKRIHKYELQIAELAVESYVKGDLDPVTAQDAINNSGVTSDEATYMWSLAQVKRSLHITHLSLGQIQKGIEDGIMSLADLTTWATRNGMPADEQSYLQLMTMFAVSKEVASVAAKAAAANAKANAAKAKAAAAAAKAAQAQALAPDKGVTVAQAETLVEDGYWTFDQLTSFLTAKGYGADAIEAIETLLQQKIAKAGGTAAAAAGVRTTAATKGLNLATVEKAVVAGILSIDDLTTFLTNQGFDAADSQVIIDLTQAAIATAQTKAAAKASATAKAADKQISLPDLERAVRLGLTTMDAYNTALQAADFDPMSITLLDGLLNAQIASDQAAAAKKTTLTAAAGQKAASLTQLEQEVVAGIRPIGDYTAALATLGFAPDDQQQLTQLLQLKVDQAKVTAAKRTAAEQALTARGISLSQAETAVKLNVVPITTYQQMLTAAGYTPDAVDVLSNSLLAEVAKTAKTQTAATSAAGVLATKGISLPQIEQAVIKGIDPIATYTTALTGAGYSAADAGTLTQLLQLKVTQAQNAAAAHADAVGAATQKGISLTNEEQGVIQGDLTIANYDALLTSLGFDSVDRGVLEALLQTKVAAAAAKAGAAAPAPATPTPGSGG